MSKVNAKENISLEVPIIINYDWIGRKTRVASALIKVKLGKERGKNIIVYKSYHSHQILGHISKTKIEISASAHKLFAM